MDRPGHPSGHYLTCVHAAACHARRTGPGTRQPARQALRQPHRGRRPQIPKIPVLHGAATEASSSLRACSTVASTAPRSTGLPSTAVGDYLRAGRADPADLGGNPAGQPARCRRPGQARRRASPGSGRALPRSTPPRSPPGRPVRGGTRPRARGRPRRRQPPRARPRRRPAVRLEDAGHTRHRVNKSRSHRPHPPPGQHGPPADHARRSDQHQAYPTRHDRHTHHIHHPVNAPAGRSHPPLHESTLIAEGSGGAHPPNLPRSRNRGLRRALAKGSSVRRPAAGRHLAA